MPKDQRDWIRQLDEAGELLHIRKEVDTRVSMGALIYESLEKALLFENIKGYPGWTCLGQAPGNWRHFGLAFGVPKEKVVEEYARRIGQGPRPCTMVSSGPVKEVIWKGADADLTKIPVHVVWQGDGGPYIGAGLSVVRDPETGVLNMAFHRMQVKGPRRTGMLARTETHIWRIYQKYEQQNQAMPIAVINGHHPFLYCAASWSGSKEVSELGLASTLMGEPLQMVKCETSDLEVPADAEIIIEGVVPPGVREAEGPFGEFQGYPVSAMGMNPVIDVNTITMRREATYKTLTNFRHEGNSYMIFNMCAVIFDRVKALGGGIDLKTVHTSDDFFTMIIQMNPQYEGDARLALMDVLTGPYLHPKIAIAIDDDVDIYDPADVIWAVSTRVNPSKDVFIVPETRGHPMDLSLQEVSVPGSDKWSRVGSKMGIDATKPAAKTSPEQRERFRRNRPVGWGQVFLKDFIG
ncbi:MAG: UbiD family decarboxylase [Dehalococcoidia bacterium]|nr:UbiD family decarboxylase [Dehalococcoidia bacterium]